MSSAWSARGAQPSLKGRAEPQLPFPALLPHLSAPGEVRGQTGFPVDRQQSGDIMGVRSKEEKKSKWKNTVICGGEKCRFFL